MPRPGAGPKLVPNGRVVERVTHWEEQRALGLEVAESDWPIHFMRWMTRIRAMSVGSMTFNVMVDYHAGVLVDTQPDG